MKTHKNISKTKQKQIHMLNLKKKVDLLSLDIYQQIGDL